VIPVLGIVGIVVTVLTLKRRKCKFCHFLFSLNIKQFITTDEYWLTNARTIALLILFSHFADEKEKGTVRYIYFFIAHQTKQIDG
jgi:hypothetical protein